MPSRGCLSVFCCEGLALEPDRLLQLGDGDASGGDVEEYGGSFVAAELLLLVSMMNEDVNGSSKRPCDGASPSLAGLENR